MAEEDPILLLWKAGEFLEKRGECDGRVSGQVKGDVQAVKAGRKRSLEDGEREAKVKRAGKKAKQQEVVYDEPVDPESPKWKFLFSKTLTPSDTNASARELNRLIIPLKAKGLLQSRYDEMTHKNYVDLVDQSGRVWSFVYKTEHGASLSVNWVKFLRDKKLQMNDEVSFHSKVEDGRTVYGITLARNQIL